MSPLVSACLLSTLQPALFRMQIGFDQATQTIPLTSPHSTPSLNSFLLYFEIKPKLVKAKASHHLPPWCPHPALPSWLLVVSLFGHAVPFPGMFSLLTHPPALSPGVPSWHLSCLAFRTFSDSGSHTWTLTGAEYLTMNVCPTTRLSALQGQGHFFLCSPLYCPCKKCPNL